VTFRYQACYCEENIWHLCQEPQFQLRQPSAVFISNDRRATPVWHQQAAPDGEPVIWDYHVVLLARGAPSWEVWDLDTTLGMPVPAKVYAEQALAVGRLPDLWAQRLRVVAAERFVATFGSNRSHMRTPEGQWSAPPPPWGLIGAGTNNLLDFVDMDSDAAGEVLSAAQFRDRYA
jgi:protein N-terminal glutamine amidohydrolase